jgi:hypothetical protein
MLDNIDLTEENIKKIQEEDIPRIEDWAKRTGSHVISKKLSILGTISSSLHSDLQNRRFERLKHSL